MALIKCKHCGGLVSSLAEKCPHCGMPLTAIQELAPQHPLQETEEHPADIVSQEATPLRQKPSNEATEDENTGICEGERSSYWLRWLIVVVVILAAAAGFLLFNRNKTEGESHSVVETKEIDSTDIDSIAVVEELDTIVHLTPEFIEAVQQYDQLGEFSEGIAPVKRNGRWGYIDVKGEVVIPFFDALFASPFSEGRACVIEEESESTDYAYPFVYIDKQGNKIFGGYMHLSLAETAGDTNADFSCPSFRNGKVVISTGADWITYNRQGNVIQKTTYYQNDEYNEEEKQGGYEVFSKEEFWGLKDASGNIVIPAKYHGFTLSSKKDVSYGVIPVYLYSDDVDDYENTYRRGLHSEKRYFGYVDLEGNDTFKDGLARRCREAYKRAGGVVQKKEELTDALIGVWWQHTGEVPMCMVFGYDGMVRLYNYDGTVLLSQSYKVKADGTVVINDGKGCMYFRNGTLTGNDGNTFQKTSNDGNAVPSYSY